jgi:pyridoxamine 5'-phosphate oxidase family protein
MFSEQEIAYLKSQRLARVATVSTQSQPDVAPVAFDFDGQHFYIGGLEQARTLKYKNVQAGNTNVAFVVDDLETAAPWRPRGIKVHGVADIMSRQGYVGEGMYIRITPTKVWSWGIEEPALQDGKPVMKKPTR